MRRVYNFSAGPAVLPEEETLGGIRPHNGREASVLTPK